MDKQFNFSNRVSNACFIYLELLEPAVDLMELIFFTFSSQATISNIWKSESEEVEFVAFKFEPFSQRGSSGQSQSKLHSFHRLSTSGPPSSWITRVCQYPRPEKWSVVMVSGFEPGSPAWKPSMLPLHHWDWLKSTACLGHHTKPFSWQSFEKMFVSVGNRTPASRVGV